MMENSLVTVVLPVYNTEKYLDECICSVVKQTYSQLEILLIDDGSADRCAEMCDAWAEKDRRIRVIHKENQGLGMARNTGIENASGEYICFFDSDDYIAPETVESAVRRMADCDAEVLIFGFHTVNEDRKITASFVPEMEQTVYSGSEVQERFFPELIAPDPAGDQKQRLYMSSCMMMYSMDLIRRSHWRFASEREIISEDVYSLLDLFASVKCAAILSEALYYYRVNHSSLSRRYKPNRYDEIRHFYLESMALCSRKGYGKEISFRVREPFLAFTRAAMKQEASAPIPVSERMRNIRRIINDETLQYVLWEKRKDTESLPRRILFWAMKHKRYLLCYSLLVAKNHSSVRG